VSHLYTLNVGGHGYWQAFDEPYMVMQALKRLMKGVRPEGDLTEMSLEVSNFPEEQYRLPLLVGHMFDCNTILAGNALRQVQVTHTPGPAPPSTRGQGLALFSTPVQCSE
jgi:hypothetical protein